MRYSIFLGLAFLALASLSCDTSSVQVRTSERATHHYVYFGRDRERITDRNFLETPRLEGAQLMYAWNELEKSEGKYDFSAIEADRKFLNAHGKQLFIQLQDATFEPTREAVPRYLIQAPKYSGGIAIQYDNRGKPEGQVARRWDPEVRNRLQALISELGKRFDGKIAGINLQETAVGIGEVGMIPSDFTPANYRDAILLNMFALQRAFPHSLAMQYANFMPGEWLPDDDKSFLRSIYQFARQNRLGIGTPDLMPESAGQKHHAYQLMRELNGAIPVGVAVQDGNYAGTTGLDIKPTKPWPNRVPQLDEFARRDLKASYLFWAAQEPYFSHDVIPYLKRAPQN